MQKNGIRAKLWNVRLLFKRSDWFFDEVVVKFSKKWFSLYFCDFSNKFFQAGVFELEILRAFKYLKRIAYKVFLCWGYQEISDNLRNSKNSQKLSDDAEHSFLQYLRKWQFYFHWKNWGTRKFSLNSCVFCQPREAKTKNSALWK